MKYRAMLPAPGDGSGGGGSGGSGTSGTGGGGTPSVTTGSGGAASPLASLDKDTYTKDEVLALNRQLEANRNEILAEQRRMRDRLKNFDGFDPEEFKALKAEAEQRAQEQERLEREKAEKEGNYKAAMEQLEKRHAAALQKERDDGAAKETFINRLLIDNAAMAEITKHSDTPTLLMPHVTKQMKVFREDGEYVARIVDAKGNIRISPTTGKGSDPMSLAELLDEMKNDKSYAVAFKGSGSSGGGASRSHSASGGGPTVITTDDGQEFLKHIDEIRKGTYTVRRTGGA